MKTMNLSDQFHSWLLGTARDPEFAGRIHRFGVRRNVHLLPGEVVDFVSVRHERASQPEGRMYFSVGLWKFNAGPVDLAAVDEMSRHIQAFRSWYADAVNQVEMKRRTNVDPAGIHGNLVGSSIASNSLIRILSNGLGDLAFWTYRRGVNRIDVEPHYEDSSSIPSQAQLFKQLFRLRSTGERRRSGRTSVPSAV